MGCKRLWCCCWDFKEVDWAGSIGECVAYLLQTGYQYKALAIRRIMENKNIDSPVSQDTGYPSTLEEPQLSR